MKHYYPAIFETAPEGGYTVLVPDLPGCITEGDSLEQAMWMVQDAIGCWLSDVEERDYPKGSGVNDVDTSDFKEFFVTLVEFDKHVYDERCRAIQMATGHWGATAESGTSKPIAAIA